MRIAYGGVGPLGSSSETSGLLWPPQLGRFSSVGLLLKSGVSS